MRSPTTQWVALNLFRLTAVVFLVWALVAQFIMLARRVYEVRLCSSGS
jgi:hypothetical protein